VFTLLREKLGSIEFTLVDNIEQADIEIMDIERVPSHYNYQVLEQEDYYLVVPTDHQLAGHVSVNINSLDKLKIIQRPYCTQRNVF
jgi:DNA-binding transcriptional LysR family regulator